MRIKNYLLNTVAFLITLFYLTGLKAQEHLGLQMSNFSGTNGIYLNPSSIASTGYWFHINFWTRGVGFYNDYMEYNAPFKLNQWANKNINPLYNINNGGQSFQQGWLSELGLDGSEKQFNFGQDIRGLAFMFPVSKTTFLSFNTRQRNGIQVRGLEEELARISRYGIDSSRGNLYNGNGALNANKKYTSNGFKAHMESYQEYSMTLGGKIAEGKRMSFTGGVTLKFLRGMGAAFVRSADGFDYSIAGKDSMVFANGDFSYGHTTENALFESLRNPYGLAEHITTGGGLGLDIGFTWIKLNNGAFKRKPTGWQWWCNYNRSSNYVWKIGGAIMDLGYIRHGKATKSYDATFGTNKGIQINPNLLDDFNNPYNDGFNAIDNSLMTQTGAAAKSSFTSFLPLALNAQADFRLSRNGFLGFNWQHSLKTDNAIGLNATSYFSVIPRIEGYLGEFALPITLNENYKSLNVGIYARFGPFFFGSDNLGGLLNVASNSSTTAASIYGGFALGVGGCFDDDPIKHYDHHIFRNDTVVKKDTVVIQTVKRDTVFVVKRDTVKIKEQTNTGVKHDTVYVKDQNALRRERELREEIRKKEEEIQKLKNQPPSPTNDVRIRELERKIDQLTYEKRLCDTMSKQKERELQYCINRQKELEKEVKELREKVIKSSPGTDCNEWLKKITILEKQKDSLGAVVRVCDEKKKELELKIISLESDKKKCNDELNKLRVELNRSRDSVTFVNNILKECKLREEQCQKEYTFVVQKLKEKEKELDNCLKNKTGTDTSALNNLRKEIETLRKEKEECGKQLETLKLKIIQLETDNQKKTVEIKRLRDTVTLLINQKNTEKEVHNQLLKEYQYCIQKTKELEAEIEKLKKQSSNSTDTTELNTIRKKLVAITKEKENLAVKLRECEDKLKVTTPNNTETEKLKKQLSVVRDSLNSSKTETEMERKKYESAKAEYEFCLKKQKELETEISNLKKQQNTGSTNKDTTELNTLRKRLIEVQSQKDANDKKLKEAETKLKECLNKPSDSGNLEKENEKLRTQLKTVRDSLNSIIVVSNNYRQQYEAAQKEYISCAQKQKELESQITNLKKQQSSNTSPDTTELNNLRKQLIAIKKDKEAFEKKLKESEDNLKSCKNKENELLNKLKECEQKLSNASTNSGNEEQLKKLQSDLDALNSAYRKLEEDLKASQQKQKELEAALTKAKTESNASTTKATELQKQLDQLNAKILELERQKTETAEKLRLCEEEKLKTTPVPPNEGGN